MLRPRPQAASSGGRPRRISPDETAYIAATALTRPEKLGPPFTRWRVRKLSEYLAANPVRMLAIGRERLRQILRRHRVSFQRTRTWKESTDPEREVKLDRIEAVTNQFPNRCFAFDQFGPLSIRPHHGGAGARWCKPVRLLATFRRTHGIRYQLMAEHGDLHVLDLGRRTKPFRLRTCRKTMNANVRITTYLAVWIVLGHGSRR
jgi:hypothetical protein